MTLRRSRKKTAVERVAQLWAGTKVAKAAGKAAMGGRNRAGMVAGALGLVAVAAALRKRRSRAREAEVDYGPPNESVPSHETLAPSQEAAGHTA
jgi:hypothetical protein